MSLYACVALLSAGAVAFVPAGTAEHVASASVSLAGTSGLSATIRFEIVPSGECCGGDWFFSTGDGADGRVSDGINNGAYLGNESGTVNLSDGRVAAYVRTGPDPVVVNLSFEYLANGTYAFSYSNCCPDITGVLHVAVGGGGADSDADGWGTPADCNDGDAGIHPGAPEVANDGIDQDCDGADLYDPCQPNGCPVDNDGDGWDEGSDCNDADASIHPGAPDTPGDGVDSDCDGIEPVITPFLARLHAYTSGRNGTGDGATFGVADGATEGYDVEHDSPQPPTPPVGEHLALFFDYPANGPGTDRLARSVVASELELRYPLQLEWQLSGPSNWTYLYWSSYDFSGIPSAWSVYLVDGATMVDMRSGYSHALSLPSGSGSRELEILVTLDVRQDMYLSAGWSLVSLYVAPRNASIGAVFGDAIDAAYAWNGSTYVPASDVVPGAGYWVHNPAASLKVQVVGKPVTNLTLTLQPGWNLVGAPQQGLSLAEAPSNVSRTAWLWWSGYYGTSWLPPGYGAWVYAHGQSAVLSTSAASPKANEPLAQRAADLLEGERTPAADEFALPLALSTSDGAADGATLVTRVGEPAGFDGRTDVVEAPRPAGDAWAQAFFLDGRLQLDRSTVAPTQKASHALRVERSGPEGLVTLSWEDAQLPEGLVFELVDGATRVDMRKATSHSWLAGDGLTARDLVVVVRAADAPVCVVALDGKCFAGLPFDPFART